MFKNMKSVTKMEGHDCKWLFFTVKESALYSFLTMCFVSLNVLHRSVGFKSSRLSVISLNHILGSHMNRTIHRK